MDKLTIKESARLIQEWFNGIPECEDKARFRETITTVAKKARPPKASDPKGGVFYNPTYPDVNEQFTCHAILKEEGKSIIGFSESVLMFAETSPFVPSAWRSETHDGVRGRQSRKVRSNGQWWGHSSLEEHTKRFKFIKHLSKAING